MTDAEKRTIYNKRYRQKHRAKLLAKEREWREHMREALRLKSTAWRRANPERTAELKKANYNKHRDKYVSKKRDYNAARRKEINAKSRSYREQNLAKVLERAARYRAANREALREKGRAYAKTRPAELRASRMKRIAAQKQAMPPWADGKAIGALYREAVRLTTETGIPHHVDHIVPLRGKTVCGLHVAHNLQVITETENLRKSNKLIQAA